MKPSLRSRALNNLRRMWKRLPVPHRARLKLAPMLATQVARRSGVLLPPPAAPETIVPGDLVLSGFFAQQHGVAEGARRTADGLTAAGQRFMTHDLAEDPQGIGIGRVASPGGVWICHCNAPEALAYMLSSDGRPWHHRYRIGYWAYELPTLPDDWRLAARLFHEIWAPSTFVAQAVWNGIAGASPRVRVVPHPLADTTAVAAERERFEIGEAFTFLTTFDGRSTAARKNPAGAIRAFQAAFGPDDRTVALVVKAHVGSADPGGLRDIVDLANGWPNIRLIERRLDRGEFLTLLASVDCYVSLHRSEGFGLVVAEAMSLARPVIATVWSGNADFCQDAVAAVPFTLAPARDATGRYDLPDQLWAEPDVDAAAAIMVDMASDRLMAQRAGTRGAELVRKRLGAPMDLACLETFLANDPGSIPA